MAMVSLRLAPCVVHFFNLLYSKDFFCETKFLLKHYREFDNPLFFKEIFQSQDFYPINPPFFIFHFLLFPPIYVQLKKNLNICVNLKVTMVSQFIH